MQVGLVLMTDADTSVGRTTAPTYARARDLALQAEAAGFDALWLYDHVLFRCDGAIEGAWECWTFLAALADATARIELGTLVTRTQYRNPALLAKMATTLDEISGGRLILGLGAGWDRPEFAALGVPFDHRVTRFEEALRIIVPLLREGKMHFEGRYFREIECEILPRGPRPGGPPILIAALGPRMLHLAAVYADLWNFGLWECLVTMRPRMQAACAAVGRDMASLGLTFIRLTVFPDLNPLPSPLPEGMRAFILGDPARLAATLRQYEESGIKHVMLDVVPNTTEAFSRVAEALRRYRQDR